MSATGWAIVSLFFWQWSHQALHGYKEDGSDWALRLSGLFAIIGVAAGFLTGWTLVRP